MFSIDEFKLQAKNQPGFIDNFAMNITSILTDVNQQNQIKGRSCSNS